LPLMVLLSWLPRDEQLIQWTIEVAGDTPWTFGQNTTVGAKCVPYCHVPWLHILFGHHWTPKISDPIYVWHCLSAITLVLLVCTAYDSFWLLFSALCFSITESSECRWCPSQLDLTWLITTRFHHRPIWDSDLWFLHYIPLILYFPINTSHVGS
jgi:hypothetical protein